MDRINSMKDNLSRKLKKSINGQDTGTGDFTTKIREEKKHVRWTVENIRLCPLEVGECLESPPFYSGYLNSTKWILRFYPKGRNVSNSKVGLFVCKIFTAAKCAVNYEIKLLVASLTKCCVSNKLNFEDLEEYGRDVFLSSEVLSKTNFLEIECDMLVKYSGETEKYQIGHEGFPSCSCTLSRDLKNLYLQKKHADATLQVGGVKIPVHKAVLGTRTRVFSEIFRHDRAQGSCPDTVSMEKVEGLTEEFVLRGFLEYIYTDKIEDANADKAISLYPVAKKYSMKELKKLCLNIILATMSVQNFCSIVALTDKHPSSRLKLATKNFFCKYSPEIMSREDWKSFVGEHGSVASDMMTTLASELKTRHSTHS